MKSKTILVDSDIFVAINKSDDFNHKKAEKLLESLLTQQVCFITTNYIFSETITVLSQKVGQTAAVKFISDIKTPQSDFEVYWITPEVEEEAIEIFRKQTSKNTSFVDCTNMAALELNKWDFIFSFDSIYKKNGFKIAEELIF